MTPQLQSHIAGRWIGTQPAQAPRSAIDGAVVAPTHDDAIDFGEDDARQLFGDRSGETSLLGLSHARLFGQQRENSTFPGTIGNVG